MANKPSNPLELWASFLHSDEETLECRSGPDDQSEMLTLNGDEVQRVCSSSFRARCDATNTQSPHQLAEYISAKAKEKFRESLSSSSLQDCANRDCIAPFKTKEIVLGKLLGSGQFSQVYKIKSFRLDEGMTTSAKEEETRQRMKGRERYRMTKKSTYALKHLRPRLADDHKPTHYAQFASDIVQEAEFLAVLQHPNIIKLRGISHLDSKGFNQGPKGYFLIIDRLNETLAKRIARWKKSTKRRSLDFLHSIKSGSKDFAVISTVLLSQQLEILLQIAAALAYLHEKNVMFRDLKPENVGFDIRGDVKLFDFGLAKILPGNSDPYEDSYKMSIAGTPRYMSPEILCQSQCNLKADVYTFSMVMWEVLSLERPFSFVRNQEALFNHVGT
jgi:serine/threonine protein kinase